MFRAVARSVLLAGVLLASGAEAAWPERPVTIVTPFAAGGIADVVARMTALRLQESLKQSFVVENQPGGAGVIAAERVVKSPPDGYTLMSTPIFQITMAQYTHHVAFDAGRDFTPISAVAAAPFVITVGGSFPGNTLAEFIAYVKANPGKVTFASAGVGSLSHVASVVVLKAAGLDMVHVPYRGVAPAFTDLLAGHIVMLSATPVELKPYLESGKVKALAVVNTTRSKHLPNVPTVLETLPNCPPAVTYNGLLGPARLAKDVVETMARELALGNSPEFEDRLLKAGLEPMLSTPAEFAKIVASDTEQWRDLVRALNLKPN
jgi:tripartite-type tricarboxylate transporter receptor subunit TctC